MKNILYKVIAIILILSISAFASAAKGHGWYIKRNGNERPSFPSDSDELREYGCYWIDDDLADGEKKIYITFDAGYENGNVEKILDILKEEKVPAAFFLLDNIILKNTDLVTRMSDEGHLVCNHTKRHRDLTAASFEEISKDLSELECIYKEKVGKDMSKYFRFPEGKYSLEAVKSVSLLGYKTIFWSFAYDDWDNSGQRSEEYALNKVLSNTHNGAVMLFHPTSSTNAAIFSRLISEWRDMGYSFGTLDELTGK